MKNKKMPAVRLAKKQNITILIISLCLAGSFLFPKIIFASKITAENIIKLTNKERIKQGLKPLKINKILEKVATNKANDLMKGQYFSHTSPNGKTFIKWFKDAQYNYLYAGENLAMDFVTSEGITKAWMQSKSHRANILSPYYTEIAVATKSGIWNGRLTTIIAQVFGMPKQISKNNPAILNNNPHLSKQINNKEKIIAFPSILNYKKFNIIHLNNKNSITESNKAFFANKAPYKENFQFINKKLNPRIAGENTQSFYRKNNTKNVIAIFYLLLPLFFCFLSLGLLRLDFNYIYYNKKNYNENLGHIN